MHEWAAEGHLEAELAPLEGEVARAAEASVVMDAGGAGDEAMLQTGGDVTVAVVMPQAGADVVTDGAMPRLVADATAGGPGVHLVVVGAHAVAVLPGALMVLSAGDVVVSLPTVRPMAVQGEVAELARLVSWS